MELSKSAKLDLSFPKLLIANFIEIDAAQSILLNPENFISLAPWKVPFRQDNEKIPTGVFL